jgi:hypothetical protein
MAVHKSDQITNQDAIPSVKNKANVERGRIRSNYFSFTVPTGDVAVNDMVQLTNIPKGARILGGWIAAEAMTTGAGAASIQIGDGTTAAKYLGTTDIDAAAQADFAHTVALNFGEELAAEMVLTATVTTESWAAGKKLCGHLRWVLD